MFSISSNGIKEDLVLIFDIQSGLINGALASIKKDKTLKIISTKTDQIQRKGHMDGNLYIRFMISTLSNIAHQLAGNHHISQAHIILSSPWIISKSKTINSKFDKETSITPKLIDNLIEQASEKNTFDEDSVYIEKKIFDIKLNGYSVTKYIDRTAMNIEIAFATTISSNNLLSMIKDAIKRPFSISKIEYHSGLLLNFISLRKLITDMNDYVYIHIHAELTDIVIVKNGICVHISSFPLGISSLIKKISQELKIDEDMVDSTLSVYKDGKFNNEEKNKINSKLDEYSNDWLNNYSTSIDGSISRELLPEVVYISSVSHVDIYKGILKSKFSENIHFVDLDVDTMVVHTLALSDVI